MLDVLTIPVLPLRDIVVFPHMVVPLVRRPREIRAGAGRGHEGRQADPAGHPKEFRAMTIPTPTPSMKSACWPLCCNC